jgi:AraC-like DNA-binding protein
MFTDNTLIIINTACIVFLLTITAIMAVATRMKGGAGWAALIIVTTTVPMFLSNLTRDLASDYFLLFWYSAYTLNTLLMPSLCFFARSRYEKSLHFVARDLLHLILPLVSLVASIVYYAPLTAEQIEAERAFLEAGSENLPVIINDIITFGQFIGYYIFIFLYIRKKKKFLQDNYSDNGYLDTRWTPHFFIVFFVLFFVVFAAYAINPRTDVWLIPILNSVAMAYLVYCVIAHSTAAYINHLLEVPTVPIPPAVPNSLPAEQMQEICHTVTQYLQTSEAYKNCDLTLIAVSHETGISPRNISAAINAYLHRNFFELVNAMRVEEAKRLLLELKTDSYTIDSIYSKCGFSSRSTFFAVFKKMEGKTPSQWLKTTP